MSTSTNTLTPEIAAGQINDMLRNAVSKRLEAAGLSVPEAEYSISYPPAGATSAVKRLKGATALASEKPVTVDRNMTSGRPRVIINPVGIVKTVPRLDDLKRPVLDSKGRAIVDRTLDIDSNALFAFALHGAVSVLCPAETSVSDKGKKQTRQYTKSWGETASKAGLNSKTKFHLDSSKAMDAAQALTAAIKDAGLYPYLQAATVAPREDKGENFSFMMTLDKAGTKFVRNAKGKEVVLTFSAESRADIFRALANRAVYFVEKQPKVETPIETTENEPAD